VEVLGSTACSLFLFFLLPNDKLRNSVTKCGAFRGFAQPNLILPMKCCDSSSGLDAHDPLLKRAPAQDFTTIVGESELARQLNRSVRTPLYCFATVSRRVGRLATHQESGPPLGSTLHAWLAQKEERKPAASVPFFWPNGSDALPRNGNVQFETNLPSCAKLPVCPSSWKNSRHPCCQGVFSTNRRLIGQEPTEARSGSALGAATRFF